MSNHATIFSSSSHSVSTLEKQLETYEIPNEIIAAYRKMGIIQLYDWQHECLFSSQVLNGSLNLIYSAPTSGGKTLIAELVGLNTVLKDHEKQRNIVVYILPYVSLVDEKYLEFKRILKMINSGLSKRTGFKKLDGIRIGAYYGDQVNGRGYQENIMICTIEKANTIFNTLLKRKRIHELKCIIVDEVHVIGNNFNGYLLEILLSKIVYMGHRNRNKGSKHFGACKSRSVDDSNNDPNAEGNKHPIQIVALSATMSNIEEIAEWLTPCKHYVSTYRPIPLREYVKVGGALVSSSGEMVANWPPPAWISAFESQSRRRSSDNISKMNLESVDPDQVTTLTARALSIGQQVIIFCNSKPACVQTCKILTAFLPMFLSSLHSFQQSTTHDDVHPNKTIVSHGPPENNDKLESKRQITGQKLFEGSDNRQKGTVDDVLIEGIKTGIAYHHAGLSSHQRQLVEMAFRQGTISVICATSTLAAGVNLPAGCVLIRSMRIGADPLDVVHYRQMSGRAGRKGQSTYGESILLVKQSEGDQALKLINQKLPPIESQMNPLQDEGNALLKVILDAYCLSLADTIDEGLDLFRHTLYFLQQQKLHREAQVIHEAMLTINFLLQFKMLSLGQSTDPRTSSEASIVTPDQAVRATRFGHAVVQCGIVDPEEAIVLYEGLLRAQDGLNLESKLHSLYLITPLDHKINPDFKKLLTEYEKSKEKSAKVSSDHRCCADDSFSAIVESVGIDVGLLYKWQFKPPSRKELNSCLEHMKLSSIFHQHGRTGKDLRVEEEARVMSACRRLWAAKALDQLFQGQSIHQVAGEFQVEAAEIDQLVKRSKMMLAKAKKFCSAIGWTALQRILTRLNEDVNNLISTPTEWLDLMALPQMNINMVRILIANHITSQDEFLRHSPDRIAQYLQLSIGFELQNIGLDANPVKGMVDMAEVAQDDQEASKDSVSTSSERPTMTRDEAMFIKLRCAVIRLQSSVRELQQRPSGAHNQCDDKTVPPEHEMFAAETSLTMFDSNQEEGRSRSSTETSTQSDRSERSSLNSEDDYGNSVLSESGIQGYILELEGEEQREMQPIVVENNREDHSRDENEHLHATFTKGMIPLPDASHAITTNNGLDSREKKRKMAKILTDDPSSILGVSDWSPVVMHPNSNYHQIVLSNEEMLSADIDAERFSLIVSDEDLLYIMEDLESRGIILPERDTCDEIVSEESECVTDSKGNHFIDTTTNSTPFSLNGNGLQSANYLYIPTAARVGPSESVDTVIPSYGHDTVDSFLKQLARSSKYRIFSTPFTVSLTVRKSKPSNAISLSQPSPKLQTVGWTARSRCPMTPFVKGSTPSRQIPLHSGNASTSSGRKGNENQPVDNFSEGNKPLNNERGAVSCTGQTLKVDNLPRKALETANKPKHKKSPYLTPFTPSKFKTPGKYFYYPMLLEDELAKSPTISKPCLTIYGDNHWMETIQPSSQLLDSPLHDLRNAIHCSRFLQLLQSAESISFELVFKQLPLHFLNGNSIRYAEGSSQVSCSWSSLVANAWAAYSNLSYSSTASDVIKWDGPKPYHHAQAFRYCRGNHFTNIEMLEEDLNPKANTHPRIKAMNDPHVVVGIALCFTSSGVGEENGSSSAITDNAFYLPLPIPLPTTIHRKLEIDNTKPNPHRVTPSHSYRFNEKVKILICRFVGYEMLQQCPGLHRKIESNRASTHRNLLYLVSRDWHVAYRLGLMHEWRLGSCLEWQLIASVMGNANFKKIALDLKSKLISLRERDVIVRGELFDPKIASNLQQTFRSDSQSAKMKKVGSNKAGSCSMDAVARLEMPTMDRLVEESKQWTNSICHPARSIAEMAACYRAKESLRVSQFLSQSLLSNGSNELFRRIEMPLLYWVSDAEMSGIEVEAKFFHQLRQGINDRLTVIKYVMRDHFGSRFSIDSPSDVNSIKQSLHNQCATYGCNQFRQYEDLFLTEGQVPSSDEWIQEQVAAMIQSYHPVMQLIAEYRSYNTLPSLCSSILNCRDHDRVKCCYNTIGTETGRITITHPPLQQIPHDCNLFKCDRVSIQDELNEIVDPIARDQVLLEINQQCASHPVFVKVKTTHLSNAIPVQPSDVEVERTAMASLKSVTATLSSGSGTLSSSPDYSVDVEVTKPTTPSIMSTKSSGPSICTVPAESVWRLNSQVKLKKEELLQVDHAMRFDYWKSSLQCCWMDQLIVDTIRTPHPPSTTLSEQHRMSQASLIKVRDGFICRPGFILLSADYCQMELRLLAHFSKDQALINAFTKSNEDVFLTIAKNRRRRLNKPDGINNEAMTEERNQVKQLCYAIIYGAGERLVAEKLNICTDQARLELSQFLDCYPGITKFVKATKKFCQLNGYVQTLLGRRRYLPNIGHSNPAIRSRAERQAVNTICQGSAADLIKLAMINTHRRFTELSESKTIQATDKTKEPFHFRASRSYPGGGLYRRMDDVRPLLQIHDELVFELKEEQLVEVSTLLDQSINGQWLMVDTWKVASIIRECMENAVILRAPLEVKIHVGHKWGSLQPLNEYLQKDSSSSSSSSASHVKVDTTTTHPTTTDPSMHRMYSTSPVVPIARNLFIE